MDPLTALLGPLGPLGLAGSALIAAGWIIVKLWKRSDDKDNVIKEVVQKHLADVKEFGAKYAEVIVENSKTNTVLAGAIERLGERIK